MTEIRIDTKFFNRALQAYLRASGKNLAETLNVKAYYVARNAAEMTKRANKSLIRKYYNRKNLSAVIAAVRWKKLTRRNSRAELAAALKKMKAAKIKAVGSLAAGWLPAIRAFGGWAKQSKSLRGTKMMGRKGFAKIAKKSDELRANATIVNFLPSKTKDEQGSSAALDRWGKRALQAAFKKEANSMEAYLMKKLKKSAKELNLR